MSSPSAVPSAAAHPLSPSRPAVPIAVTAHGEVQELLAFAPRGKVLGYTYRTEAG